MPLTATETLGAGAAIKSEAAGTRSREAITIVSGTGLVLANTVLGRITATGKYGLYDNDASDGRQTVAGILLADTDATSTDARQTVAGILLADTDATSTDARAVVFVRDCEVWTSRLVWGAGVTTQAEKDAAYLEMAAAGIVLR